MRRSLTIRKPSKSEILARILVQHSSTTMECFAQIMNYTTDEHYSQKIIDFNLKS